MVEGYLENVKIYDPIVGQKYRLKTIINEGKDLYGVLENDYKVILNISEENNTLCDIFGIENINNRSLTNSINLYKENVYSIFSEREYNVTITSKSKDVLYGSISLSLQEDLKKKFFEDLKKPSDQCRVYDCKIITSNGGGYIGSIEGLKVFIPGSHASHTRLTDFSSLIGKTIKCMVESYLKDTDIFVVSNKKYIHTIVPKLLENIDYDTLYTGKITGITDYGIFLDFEDYFVGLIHESEMDDTTKEKYINKSFNVKDTISFYVKSINGVKIICTCKSPQDVEKENNTLASEIKGKTYIGNITKVIKKGYLVEIQKGLQGFLPIKEAVKLSSNIQEGSLIKVLVEEVEVSNKNIYLKAVLDEQ